MRGITRARVGQGHIGDDGALLVAVDEVRHTAPTEATRQLAERYRAAARRLFTAIGRHDEIATEIQKRFGGISDSINPGTSMIAPPPVPPDVLQDIKRIPTKFKGFKPAV